VFHHGDPTKPCVIPGGLGNGDDGEDHDVSYDVFVIIFLQTLKDRCVKPGNIGSRLKPE